MIESAIIPPVKDKPQYKEVAVIGPDKKAVFIEPKPETKEPEQSKVEIEPK